MNIHVIGSTYFYLLIALIFFEQLTALIIGLVIASSITITARLFVNKKRKSIPKNHLLDWVIRYIPTGLLYTILKELNSRSFISMHTARLAMLFFVLGISISSYFYLGLILSLVMGYLRILEGYHDFVDVAAGFIVGLYSGYMSYYIMSLL